MVAFPRLVLPVLAATLVTFLGGCSDDADTIRRIRSQRQAKMQSQTQQDHIGETFSLLSRLVELNPDEAERQIAYHLNRWSEDRDEVKADDISELLRTISDVLPPEAVQQRIDRKNFSRDDTGHLRDSYLFKRISDWVNRNSSDDLVLTDWLAEQDKNSSETALQLRTAARLFDWTVRNVSYEAKVPVVPAPPAPPMSMGMTFQGPGYRQTDYQTVWRGTGDALQRAGVFTQLCRQSGLAAFVLAIPSTDDGSLDPWCVGVLIDNDIYLFEPELGIFIPGPGQVGIATLADARKDASVLRRLNVPGFFDYPHAKDDVQQTVALLNVIPEAISPRMKELQSGLAGDRRMVTYVDAPALAEQIDSISGISGVRLWNVPLLAEAYQTDMETAASRDPMFQFWYQSRWAILEADIDTSRQLAAARWDHLLGKFDNDDSDDSKGARVQYLAMRAPEFEIADLRIDVNLQIAYGIRRERGTESAVYDRQVQQVQAMMRQGKRSATYWISLIQYDDQRYDTAETWFAKRVLDENQPSLWIPAARYNLARTHEQLGDLERAVELYKTVGSPQEHGNRIRARLVQKQDE
ncbi:MAG: tetratricopeptide repeat protein [Rubripirellula sp.]